MSHAEWSLNPTTTIQHGHISSGDLLTTIPDILLTFKPDVTHDNAIMVNINITGPQGPVSVTLPTNNGQAVQAGLSCTPPTPTQNFRENGLNQKILLHQYRNIFSCKVHVYKLYFSQSEMLMSNIQLGYLMARGGGQAVQAGLSCPPPRISERTDDQQILLHHVIQEY